MQVSVFNFLFRGQVSLNWRKAHFPLLGLVHNNSNKNWLGVDWHRLAWKAENVFPFGPAGASLGFPGLGWASPCHMSVLGRPRPARAGFSLAFFGISIFEKCLFWAGLGRPCGDSPGQPGPAQGGRFFAREKLKNWRLTSSEMWSFRDCLGILKQQRSLAYIRLHSGEKQLYPGASWDKNLTEM